MFIQIKDSKPFNVDQVTTISNVEWSNQFSRHQFEIRMTNGEVMEIAADPLDDNLLCQFPVYASDEVEQKKRTEDLRAATLSLINTNRKIEKI